MKILAIGAGCVIALLTWSGQPRVMKVEKKKFQDRVQTIFYTPYNTCASSIFTRTYNLRELLATGIVSITIKQGQVVCFSSGMIMIEQ